MNSAINKQFWEEKYLNKNTPWDIGQAAPAFVKYFSRRGLLQKAPTELKKIAVLGCGRGYDTFYPGEKDHNFQVYGFDFSPSAIVFCKKLKEKKKLKNIHFKQTDFFKLKSNKKWKGFFDIVLEHTCLAAIDPKKRKDYFQLVNYLLKPKGKLIGLFIFRPIKMGGPPFGITQREIRKLTKNNFVEIEKLHRVKCLHSNNIKKGDEYLGIFEKRKTKLHRLPAS